MKQINNIKSEVYLSTYDDSDIFLPVSREHKNAENICVAVKFGDIVIKISPANTCKCSWDEAIEKHEEKLTNPAYWQMVGSVHHEVNQALKMLEHDPINWVWSSTQFSGYHALLYRGSFGVMYACSKYHSYSVRATLAFQL